MITLTLLLLSQYTLDPEPILQLETQNEFNTYPSIERSIPSANLLGVPDPDTGEVGSDVWFVAETFGFTGGPDGIGYYDYSDHAFDIPDHPVIVLEEHGHLYFVLTDDHIPYFLSRWVTCKECYVPTDLGGDFKRRLEPALKSARERGWVGPTALYTTRLEKIDLWPSSRFTAADVAAMGDDKWRSVGMWRQPWMLKFIRIHIAPELFGNSEELVPNWVQTRLGHNQVWVNRAKTAIGELSWAEFYVQNGYIPGDRSVLDMIYTFKLRETIPFTEYKRRMTYGVRCEPEIGPRGFGVGGRYTACAELLWNEERDANQRESNEMSMLVDVYAGGK